jgi:hypothetical protein
MAKSRRVLCRTKTVNLEIKGRQSQITTPRGGLFLLVLEGTLFGHCAITIFQLKSTTCCCQMVLHTETKQLSVHASFAGRYPVCIS